MIKSMTGFGNAKCELPEKLISIEIKSLNSKQLDVNIKTPTLYKEKDSEIRALITERLQRGKIDILIAFENNNVSNNTSLNKDLVREYYAELRSLSKELGEEDKTDFLSIIMKLPDVFCPDKDEFDINEWEFVQSGVKNALSDLDAFRLQEGKIIEKDFKARTDLILQFLKEIDPFENARIDAIKSRLRRDIEQLLDQNQIDKNRFEQELLYYIEKIDITEEKVRLKKHCEYFLETMDSDISSGKKLGFIAQEMGREINTIGSKANDVNIQKIVVKMKDELEKIKEQLSNVL
jgi:uncharacterized protein (TIGR00255 family)